MRLQSASSLHDCSTDPLRIDDVDVALVLNLTQPAQAMGGTPSASGDCGEGCYIFMSANCPDTNFRGSAS